MSNREVREKLQCIVNQICKHSRKIEDNCVDLTGSDVDIGTF